MVDPIFFPGGNIGDLAVNGTVNDVAICGARPLFLSTGLIIEAGFPKADLRRILASMGRAAEAAGVQIVTGDTKVVAPGNVDKINERLGSAFGLALGDTGFVQMRENPHLPYHW